MSDLFFIHALDKTTSFLSVFQEHFRTNFFVIEPNKDSVDNSIKYLQEIPANSAVIFLGHGHSTGLYTPEAVSFKKYTFVDKSNGKDLFANKKVILLSCRSSEFISRINLSNQIIGFGNILSSVEELGVEASLETGYYRDLSEDDINYFNSSYCFAIISALKLYTSGIYLFKDIPVLIEFYVNKKINETLLNKEINNRVEIARLLFEFRNEMLFLKNS